MIMKRILITFLVSIIFSLKTAADTKQLKHFFDHYCVDCHGGKKTKGGINLRKSEFWDPDANNLEQWQEIHDQIKSSDMPPEDEKQPSDLFKKEIMEMISAKITLNKSKFQAAVETRLRRLNKFEYRNTILDLLKIKDPGYDPGRSLPADNTVDNFNNNGEALTLSGFHLKEYISAAREAIDRAVVMGKKPKPVTYLARPAFIGDKNVLKAGKQLGGNRHLDLLEKRSYAFSPDFQKGVPVSGYYKVYARLAAKNRLHKLPRGIITKDIYAKEKIKASLILTDPSTGNSAYLTVSDKLIKVFELDDDKTVTISTEVWLEKGQTVKVGFHNAPPEFKKVRYRLLKKVKGIYKKPKNAGAFQSYLKSQEYWQDNGPLLRVYEIGVQGPYIEQWPPESHKIIMGNKSINDCDALAVIDSFATKAFRRPIKDEDTLHIKNTMKAMFAKGYTKEEVLKTGLTIVLSSPQFLYLYENEGLLDSFALANRLSYFLWASPPDKELYELAASGSLNKPAILRQQIQRMIVSDKINKFINNFANSWLELHKFGSMPPNKATNKLYYQENLEYFGRQETVYFIRHLLRNNLDIENFLDSEFTFLNKGLAKFYGYKGLANFRSDQLKKSPVLNKKRGGLLGQMSILTASANGVDTSPIVRGIWVLHNILDIYPKTPPQDVAALEPDVRNAVTIRQTLEKHRDSPDCRSCHKKIDPPGFALENYDHVGRWREGYALGEDPKKKKRSRVKIDSTGEIMGQSFKDIVGFKKILSENKGVFAACLTKKLLSYSTGRTIREYEKESISKIVDKLSIKGYGFADLVTEVALSDFLGRNKYFEVRE